MKHYAKWMEVQKIHPQDDYMLRINYTKMLSACPDLADVCLNDFLKCCNSVFILADKIYGNTLGIIAIRQASVEELKIAGLGYYCLDNQALYKIEAFHCDSNVSDEDCSKLINTAIADKNDGFIFYHPVCPTVKDRENFKDFVGFTETIAVKDNKELNYFVKPPAVYGEASPERQIEEVTELA